MSAALAQLGELLRSLPGFDPESFDPQKVIDQLTDEQVMRLLGPISKETEYIRTHKYDLLFPDEGLYPRHRYPKHLEFFRAGLEYRERCFMAANRCLGPWTYLETAAQPRLSAEVWTSTNACGLTWVDGSRCAAQFEAGFLKSIEPAYRLVTASGQFFDCSKLHRVLTSEGWIDLDQLVSLSSGLRYWQTRVDYQASCEADGYLGDQPLRSIAGSDLKPPPSLVGVQRRAPLIYERSDEVERTLRRTLSGPEPSRLSTRGDLARFADLFALFAGPSSLQPVLSLSVRSQALQQLALGLAHPQADAEFQNGQHGCQDLAYHLTQFPDAPCMPLQSGEIDQADLQLLSYQPLGRSVTELDHDVERMAIFYPSSSPVLIGGERIVAVVPLGLQPIIDAHVPQTECYLAGGVIHHNTGKTVAGAFETCAHLTGLYKPWWEGRKFTQAIDAWAAGDTNETTRDIIQKELFGNISWSDDGKKCFDGTGMVHRSKIGRITWKSGVQDLADTVEVRHVTGRWSRLGLKSYDQGRRVFQGTAKAWIWLDEECPLDVYGECLYRTATTGGMVALTFTPLLGISETVLSFLPAEMRPDL